MCRTTLCSVVFLSLIFLIAPAHAQQRDASIGEVWHSYWKLKGSLERRLDMETAVLMQRVEKNPNATSTTVIENQTVNIGQQINNNSLTVGNLQSTTIVNSHDVKVVHSGTQKNSDSSVGTHITTAGGDASSESYVSIVDQVFKRQW